MKIEDMYVEHCRLVYSVTGQTILRDVIDCLKLYLAEARSAIVDGWDDVGTGTRVQPDRNLSQL